MTSKLLCFLLFTPLLILAQPKPEKNFKSYPATQSWNFLCEQYALSGSATVQIVKIENGGILKLAVQTTDPTFTIAGTAYIFLIDNTSIACIDKAKHEVAGNLITTYYFLTAAEIKKLQNTDIQSIHFNIKGNSKGFSSQLGNFTAVNRKEYFATAYDKTKKTYDTATEIKSLYN
jgi:hypothetical protein